MYRGFLSKKRGRLTSPSSQSQCLLKKLLLLALLLGSRNNNDTAIGLLTLRMRHNVRVAAQGQMHNLTLVGLHRMKSHFLAALQSTSGARLGNSLKLCTATVLVAFNVHNDRELEA